MSLRCNWPNCSMEFVDQKQLQKHLMGEHVGEHHKNGNELATSQQQQVAVINKPNRKQIFIPMETYVDILLWISRIELAQTVSLTCWLFNEIARPRLDEQNERIVSELRFFQDPCHPGIAKLKKIINGHYLGGYEYYDDELENFIAVDDTIPIAQIPPPINILGFECLDIWCIDSQVVEFIRLIAQLLDTKRPLDISGRVDNYSANVHFPQIQMILAGKITHLCTQLDIFKKMQMEFLQTIQYVQLWRSYGGKHDNKVILEWLHSPFGNDNNGVAKSRFIFMHHDKIGQIAELCKQHFVKSTSPASFVFHFDTIRDDPKLFNVKNNQTHEQLILGWHYDGGKSYFMLRRSPIGDDQGWRNLLKEHEQMESTSQINLRTN